MKALLIVDIQHDFLPGGALGVQEGDKVIPVINRLTKLPFTFIAASKDWHPKDHGSFASSHNKTPGDKVILEGLPQILWPNHCVQESLGAEFPAELNKKPIQCIIYKGTDKNLDSYSAFFDNGHKKATKLNEELKKEGIKELFIAGLATDYCVKYSALDAIDLGYKVYVIKEACRAVNLNPQDELIALNEIKKKGGVVINEEEVNYLLRKENP